VIYIPKEKLNDYIKDYAKKRRSNKARMGRLEYLRKKKKFDKEQMKLVYAKTAKLITASFSLDRDTLTELDKYIQDTFKSITRTEFIRLATEYCLKDRKFIAMLKELD